MLRMKDGCFGGVIAMDVRGDGSLYIYNFLENDFGEGLPAYCGKKFPLTHKQDLFVLGNSLCSLPFIRSVKRG